MNKKVNKENLKQLEDELRRVTEENIELHKSLNEEYRINGMGQERELKLITENRKLFNALRALVWVLQSEIDTDTLSEDFLQYLNEAKTIVESKKK